MSVTRRSFVSGLGLSALALGEFGVAAESTARGKLHVPRYGPALTTDGRRALLSGGAPIGAENKDGYYHSNLLGLVESIDPESLAQRFLANALYVRANHAAVWLNDQLWLLGGRTRLGSTNRLVAETERINLQTQAIWPGPDLPTGLIHLCAVTYRDSVFVFGGIFRDYDSNQSHASSRVFECASPYDRWQERAPMTTAVSNAPAVVVGNEIFVIGGYDRHDAHAITQVYDPANDVWRMGPTPPVPLSAHGAAAAHGRIYSFGDYANQATVLGFDVGSGAWRAMHLPFTPRRHVRAVTVGNRIVVAGGNQSSQAPATDVVESYSTDFLADIYLST